MTQITRIDRLLDRLRTELERKSSAGASSGNQAAATGLANGTRGGQSASISAVLRDLAASGVTEERVLVTFLVERLMRENLGETISKGPEFHQMLDVVVDALADDEEAWSLCQVCVAEAMESH